MPSSSGRATIAKGPFNCFECGTALSHGAFLCFYGVRFPSHQECQQLFCSECSRIHAERSRHNTGRLAVLDDFVANATFACPYDGCGEELSASDYDAHVETCLFKTLQCPRCANLFASNALISHLVGEHQFALHELTYAIAVCSEISNNSGCILRGLNEAFVFFLDRGELYYFWIGSSPAPADFGLWVTVETQADHSCGNFTKTAVARCRDFILLLNLDQNHVIPQNNILRITIVIS